MQSAYTDWLQRQGTRLVEGAGVLWRPYRGALVPATGAPCFLDVSRGEARRLLRESGCWLLRYSSDPSSEPTAWWYVFCDSYDLAMLPSKTRSEINRGRRQCTVDRVEVDWLANNGYDCYRAAVGRYAGSEAIPVDRWRDDVLRSIDGPFEYWGVFVGQKLAGYSRCIVETNNVATSAIRLDPDHLKDRTSYALTHQMLATYVSEQGKSMTNGNRSVAHETRFQEFLIKFGFRQLFCRLNIVYRLPLRAAIAALYPLRRAASKLKGGAVESLNALLLQEEWCRSAKDALPPSRP